MPGERRADTILDSWKSIAAHFGVTVRTVQNWETARGLPIHRLPGGSGRVWARLDELEAWSRNGHPPALPAETRGRPRMSPGWVAGLVAVLVLAAAVPIALLSPNGAGTVTECHLSGQVLIATDGNGKEAWRYRLDGPVRPDWADVVRLYPRLLPAVVDITGDGKPEVLFPHLPPVDAQQSDTLLAISHSGRLLWRWVPGRKVGTRRGAFSPPFGIYGSLVLPRGDGGKPAVLVVGHHRIYYPAQVALLSTGGKVLREYWHSGQLNQFLSADLSGEGKPTIYLGGIANGYSSAVLVALDPAEMDGASREENADYQLLGFSPAREKARILLPRTKLDDDGSVWKYNGVDSLAAQDRSLEIVVSDTFAAGSDNHPLVLFGLDQQLRCTRVAPHDNFYPAYRALGRDEKLTAQDFAALQTVRYLSGP